MTDTRMVVIGAGMGGLAAAITLAARGATVTVLESAATPGGKLREVVVDGARLDAGPTVFTMRWVFEELFAAAGTNLATHVVLRRPDLLARHAWNETERLDLFSDIGRSAEAVGDFAGSAAARGYRAFAAESRRIYETLEHSFLRAPRPTILSLTRDALRRGPRGLGDLWRTKPFGTLWSELGRYFPDPRLRQLFGRYATYCGASPFLAPATLMLIAHVEREGVWLVEGGIYALAQALESLATARGAVFRYGCEVEEIVVRGGRATGVRLASGEHIQASAVLVNADSGALADGHFGAAARQALPHAAHAPRSLSAITWALRARAEGFALDRHNVFFSRDYGTEFDDLFRRGQPPVDPTVYVCAQDRGDGEEAGGRERLFCLINAPAAGDSRPLTDKELARCRDRAFAQLSRCGLRLQIDPEAIVTTTPADFHQMFPATGGALYGPATHGWKSSFVRPTARSRIPGLWLAGGGIHPGPGLPMAALSGMMAAVGLLEDHALISPFHRAAMPGGTSTRSAMTDFTA